MTTEHLRPLLSDDAVVASVGFRLEVQMVRLGWMTAFTKPDGGVRGIAAGDVVRRLVSRTMAHQMGKCGGNSYVRFPERVVNEGGDGMHCTCTPHQLSCILKQP